VRIRVVDNGSRDWPLKPVFPPAVEVLHCLRPGSYAARNLALKDWDVDVVAFTDSDCRPDPCWLEEGVRFLQQFDQAAGLVAGSIVIEAPGASLANRLDQLLGFDQERSVRRGGYGATANLFASRAVIERLGGFSDHTRSGGDRDFCLRARAAGFPLVFCEHAVVFHPARDWDELVHKQRRIVGGKLALAPAGFGPRLTVLLMSLRPLVSEWWKLMRAPSLNIVGRLALMFLALLLRLAVLLEWARLQCPGQQGLR
jgi:hypothetical protein